MPDTITISIISDAFISINSPDMPHIQFIKLKDQESNLGHEIAGLG